jgi:type I restriction enzyme M protein
MRWVAPSEKDAATDTLEKRLWDAADQLRANSGLTSAQYSTPVLGLIFLRFAEIRFVARCVELEKAGVSSRRAAPRTDDPAAYHAAGVLYLTVNARFEYLLSRPESANVGKDVNEAMRDIEKHNLQLAGVLPKTYEIFTSILLKPLLKKVSEIPPSLDYDAFGLIYEYFLGEFARTEGQKGGEFYTPSSIVRLIVEILEPFHGRILDPACGSGGMFVQSARFVAKHRSNPSAELSIYGQEKVAATVALCRMNLAMHGLEGDIREAITYYDDLHESPSRFDFVLANPPFNVNAVDKERLKDAIGPHRRFPFGLPRTDNANYLWIQLFYSALDETGAAGFVMANSASDARDSEQELRRKLLEARAVDVMVAVGPNMFYTVTLPCTLWFMDKAKAKLAPCPPSPQPSPSERGGFQFQGLMEGASERGAGGEGLAANVLEGYTGARYSDTVLFIDARHIYRQIDRAHRDWTDAQIGFLANIVRLYRGKEPDFILGGEEAKAKLAEVFPSPSTGEGQGGGRAFAYRDVPGLCKAATLAEIEAQGWSLNPGRYVGVAPGEEVSDEDFKEKLEALNEELEALNAQARELEQTITQNVAEILEA